MFKECLTPYLIGFKWPINGRDFYQENITKFKYKKFKALLASKVSASKNVFIIFQAT